MTWTFLEKQTSRTMLPTKLQMVQHPGTRAFLQHFHFRPEEIKTAVRETIPQLFGNDTPLVEDYFRTGKLPAGHPFETRYRLHASVTASILQQALFRDIEAIKRGDWEQAEETAITFGMAIGRLLEEGVKQRGDNGWWRIQTHDALTDIINDLRRHLANREEYTPIRESLSREQLDQLTAHLQIAFATGIALHHYLSQQTDEALATLLWGVEQALKGKNAVRLKGDYNNQLDDAITALINAGALASWQQNAVQGHWASKYPIGNQLRDTLKNLLGSGKFLQSLPKAYHALASQVQTTANFGYFGFEGAWNDDWESEETLSRLLNGSFIPQTLFSLITKAWLEAQPEDKPLDLLQATPLRQAVRRFLQQIQDQDTDTIHNALGHLRESLLLTNHHPNLSVEGYLSLAAVALEGMRMGLTGADALARSLLWLGGIVRIPGEKTLSRTTQQLELLRRTHETLLATLGFGSQQEWEQAIPPNPIEPIPIPTKAPSISNPPKGVTVHTAEQAWREIENVGYQRVAKAIGDPYPTDRDLKRYVVTSLTEQILSDSKMKSILQALGAIPTGASHDVAHRWLQTLVDGMIGVWATTALNAHFLSWFLQERAAKLFQSSAETVDLLRRRQGDELQNDLSFLVPPTDDNWGRNLLDAKTESILPEPYQALGRHLLHQHRQLQAAAPFVDKFLTTIYINTQQLLQEAGFAPNSAIRLYRGMAGLSLSRRRRFRLVHQPISSFTTDAETAYRFGDDQYEMLVPRINILTTPFTGFGCLSEQEIGVVHLSGEAVRIED